MAIRVVGTVVGTSAADVIQGQRKVKERRKIIRNRDREEWGITFINQYVIILLFLPFENR